MVKVDNRLLDLNFVETEDLGLTTGIFEGMDKKLSVRKMKIEK